MMKCTNLTHMRRESTRTVDGRDRTSVICITCKTQPLPDGVKERDRGAGGLVPAPDGGPVTAPVAKAATLQMVAAALRQGIR
jgi:hypothetical protein